MNLMGTQKAYKGIEDKDGDEHHEPRHDHAAEDQVCEGSVNYVISIR